MDAVRVASSEVTFAPYKSALKMILSTSNWTFYLWRWSCQRLIEPSIPSSSKDVKVLRSNYEVTFASYKFALKMIDPDNAKLNLLRQVRPKPTRSLMSSPTKFTRHYSSKIRKDAGLFARHVLTTSGIVVNDLADELKFSFAFWSCRLTILAKQSWTCLSDSTQTNCCRKRI